MLRFDELSVIWPGSVRRKPLEITLPHYLRAVTVADAPFGTNNSQCRANSNCHFDNTYICVVAT